ncbi:MAG: AAA-like domain-containing protein [Chitinophagales bacterium]
MKKRFNITGTCVSSMHYMMDNKEKLKGVINFIEYGEYFTINRPRQYGKTTTLYEIVNLLKQSENYLTIHTNFQAVSNIHYESEQNYTKFLMTTLQERLKRQDIVLEQVKWKNTVDLESFSSVISEMVDAIGKKVVLLIDEVDESGNYEIFVKFLGVLRSKYLERYNGGGSTFHSVVLVGVHDVKTLKYKIRLGDEVRYNSPWNIATDFKVEMSFNPKEIAPMLVEYAEEEGVEMDVSAIAERLYYHTSGYPFLVSKLCKTIAEDILPSKTEKVWTLEEVEEAIQLLLRENNTNFDSLIKTLERHSDLYDLVFNVIIESENVPFNQHDPTIHLGVLHGIFKPDRMLQIHNRIYEQIIYNYMVSKTRTTTFRIRQYDFHTAYVNKDNTLNIEGILLRFQQFMQEQYSGQDQSFLEREWRLIFLAFLKPIINGKGHDFKEPQISDEKRLDIVVTYFERKYIIELKRWYGDKLHEEGLNQLSDYLDRQNETKGFLVIFEYRTAKTWRQERIVHKGKEIFAVWI